MPEIDIEYFIAESLHLPIVDVRSPAEYALGHIPGAINIPLFSNDERAAVGTIYKQKGREEAIQRGLEFVGPKMADIVSKARKLVAQNEVLVHCWRGGMRSSSVAWLLNTAGIKAHTLKGGYKSFRRFAFSLFERPVNLVLLGGETGSGKTAYLQALKDIGEQVIDLEALAHHKGSSFGAIGQPVQPTDEQFLNLLASEWLKHQTNKRIWLEDESHNIGGVRLPESLWKQMKAAPLIKLSVPKPYRTERLVKEYGNLDAGKLKESILRIKKRLGGLETKLALEALEIGNLGITADLLLNYYDRSYLQLISKKHPENLHEVHLPGTDIKSNAMQILKVAERIC